MEILRGRLERDIKKCRTEIEKNKERIASIRANFESGSRYVQKQEADTTERINELEACIDRYTRAQTCNSTLSDILQEELAEQSKFVPSAPRVSRQSRRTIVQPPALKEGEIRTFREPREFATIYKPYELRKEEAKYIDMETPGWLQDKLRTMPNNHAIEYKRYLYFGLLPESRQGMKSDVRWKLIIDRKGDHRQFEYTNCEIRESILDRNRWKLINTQPRSKWAVDTL